jgi:ESCRT-I complex subunit TSG101
VSGIVVPGVPHPGRIVAAKLISRLIDLVAEDNAIEDTIYHLTRALDSERIDLDKFLKVSLRDSFTRSIASPLTAQSIRSLGREQYLKRALIERILQGMGQGQTW